MLLRGAGGGEGGDGEGTQVVGSDGHFGRHRKTFRAGSEGADACIAQPVAMHRRISSRQRKQRPAQTVVAGLVPLDLSGEAHPPRILSLLDSSTSVACSAALVPAKRVPFPSDRNPRQAPPPF